MTSNFCPDFINVYSFISFLFQLMHKQIANANLSVNYNISPSMQLGNSWQLVLIF